MNANTPQVAPVDLRSILLRMRKNAVESGDPQQKADMDGIVAALGAFAAIARFSADQTYAPAIANLATRTLDQYGISRSMRPIMEERQAAAKPAPAKGDDRER